MDVENEIILGTSPSVSFYQGPNIEDCLQCCLNYLTFPLVSYSFPTGTQPLAS